MIRAAQVRAARKRYLGMAPVLDEQSRRRFVALGGLGPRVNLLRGVSCDVRESHRKAIQRCAPSALRDRKIFVTVSLILRIVTNFEQS
jgi:hypothetical protein